jgi:hypothetical protein
MMMWAKGIKTSIHLFRMNVLESIIRKYIPEANLLLDTPAASDYFEEEGESNLEGNVDDRLPPKFCT